MFTIQIDDSQRASIERLCSSVAKAAKTAVAERGIFNFALSGGNTANDIFEVLCASDIAWEKTRFFWGVFASPRIILNLQSEQKDDYFGL